MLQNGLYKAHKKWMRTGHCALVFRVVLNANKPRVCWQFHDLHQAGLPVNPGSSQACGLELLTEDHADVVMARAAEVAEALYG